jgi:hypothetical protein
MNGARPSLGFESRHNKVAKQLAVFIDTHRPGGAASEETSHRNSAGVARGVRVISLSANDVLVDGDSSRETIETVLSEMTDEVLCEDGQISHAWKRTDLSVNIEPTSMDLSNGRRNAAGWNRSIDLPRQKEFADVKIVTPCEHQAHHDGRAR